jgi:hypothetical protein
MIRCELQPFLQICFLLRRFAQIPILLYLLILVVCRLLIIPVRTVLRRCHQCAIVNPVPVVQPVALVVRELPISLAHLEKSGNMF